ncbi:MAG: hypothetical protein JOY70_00130 [Acidisphaera sp.]|nr:hypothetical protein [Acidisphaera sp.]MBV9812396.1 hypothetical protein [Acetobacteraceae bacterium]
MMRRVTVLTMLMAAGSGLYLYQAKHHAQLETQRIARLLGETDAVRQRIGLLVTDYQLENDPERLRDLVGKYLPPLHGTQPPQFASLADLEKRLPPVPPPPDPNAPPAEEVAPLEAGAKPADAASPALALAAKAPGTDPQAKAALRQTAATPTPGRGAPADRVVAAAAPSRSASRPKLEAALETPVAAHPLFAPARLPAPMPAMAPAAGSLLGMARQSGAPTVTYSAFQGTGG